MSKQRLNNLFFFLGIAAVIVMLFTFDVSFVELWEHICHAGYWLIPIVGVWIIIYGINALSWREIILSEIRKKGELLAEEYLPEGVRIEAYVPSELAGKLDHLKG